jgi:hypothetical protein
MAQATRRPAKSKATGRRRGSEPRAAPPPPPAPICQVAFCPICTTVSALGEVKPELMEHLLVAGREILLAMRSIIDSRLEGSEPPAKLQRLTIQ